MAEEREFRIPEDTDISNVVKAAKEVFYKDPNVIGVGIGHRRKGPDTHHDEPALIIYVKTKLDPDEVDENFRIDPTFQGLATDVVAPFSPDSPKEALGFSESHQHSDDMSYIDWPRLHAQWTTVAAAGTSPGNVKDSGNVCVIQDDGTLTKTVNGQLVVDYVRAYKLFRTTHADIFDFVTFFTDTANGMPPQGGSSWYRFVFNDTSGIGFDPTFDQRAGYESDVLQGIMFLNQGHFSVWRYVMLQEQGHRWASFARYKDPQNGFNQTDHLLGGWGHWTLNLDDGKSPMDYDIYDWVENGPDFNRVALGSEERSYCDLDLYLMGLVGPNDPQVKDFFLLSNVAHKSGNLFSADKKTLSIQDFIAAEGARTPGAGDSQKSFKNAFVVLTGDANASQGFVSTVDSLRVRFQNDFFEATRGTGKVDTTLRVRSKRKGWW